MVIHKCEACGKEKEYKYPSIVKKYCSHKCANGSAWQKRERAETVNIKCQTCGGVFVLKASELRVREKDGGKVRYCSKTCMGIGMTKKKSIPCKNCGKLFETTRQVFCSFRCSMGYRIKTGATKRTGYWLENGYKVLYLDGDTSIKEHIKIMQDHIGREIYLGECVHHINGDILDNDIGNLQLMKMGDHSRLHRKKEKEDGKHLFGGYHNN